MAGDEPPVDVDLLSLEPKILRFRGMLTAKECSLLRLLMLEAVIYLGDFSASVTQRPGAVNSSSGFGSLGGRPWLRAQNSGHISFYFKEPPDFMLRMVSRVATTMGVHVNNVEPIYHLYMPGQVTANLHLDNFNKYLFPHRYLSVSLFLDDYDDGGTVFPLLLDSFGDAGGITSLALQHDDVREWQRMLNEERMRPVNTDSEAYAHRRVDSDEPREFRRLLLEAAQDMCRSGRARQIPVVPEKGTMYLWFNYLRNGEDDVRSIHAGCSSSVSYKMLGALFLRDGPGPFREHESFWDPRAREAPDLQRKTEMLTVHGFRIEHMPALFNLERQVVFELWGGPEAVKLAWFHYEYAQRLVDLGAGASTRDGLHGLIHRYGFEANVPWSQKSQQGTLF